MCRRFYGSTYRHGGVLKRQAVSVIQNRGWQREEQPECSSKHFCDNFEHVSKASAPASPWDWVGGWVGGCVSDWVGGTSPNCGACPAGLVVGLTLPRQHIIISHAMQSEHLL